MTGCSTPPATVVLLLQRCARYNVYSIDVPAQGAQAGLLHVRKAACLVTLSNITRQTMTDCCMNVSHGLSTQGSS